MLKLFKFDVFCLAVNVFIVYQLGKIILEVFPTILLLSVIIVIVVVSTSLFSYLNNYLYFLVIDITIVFGVNRY